MAAGKTWTHGPYALTLYPCGPYRDGRQSRSYMLAFDGEVMFSGYDYSPAPSMRFDSDESAATLLRFLSLQPGDVDEEYFANYTPAQLAFVGEHGEALDTFAYALCSEV